MKFLAINPLQYFYSFKLKIKIAGLGKAGNIFRSKILQPTPSHRKKRAAILFANVFSLAISERRMKADHPQYEQKNKPLFFTTHF